MNIAVIILNYNSAADVAKCIGFLKKQTDATAELIVVDNCSREDDRREVERLCTAEGTTFIASTENRGYAAGNNIGLRYACGKGYKYALIANPDMEFPEQDYLAKLIFAAEEDEQSVIVASDIVSVDGEHQNPLPADGNWRNSFIWVKYLFNPPQRLPYTTSDFCAKISGCCFLIRLDFVQAIGFFDEHTFLYCEEAILARQVEIANKRIYYTAGCQAIHRHIKSEKGNVIRRLEQVKRSRIYFIKHYADDTWLGKRILIMSFMLNYWIMCLYFQLNKKHGAV